MVVVACARVDDMASARRRLRSEPPGKGDANVVAGGPDKPRTGDTSGLAVVVTACRCHAAGDAVVVVSGVTCVVGGAMGRGAGEVHVGCEGRGATTTIGTVVDVGGLVLGAWATGCVTNGGGNCGCESGSDGVKSNGGAVGTTEWRP
jgi:hypothetical protein